MSLQEACTAAITVLETKGPKEAAKLQGSWDSARRYTLEEPYGETILCFVCNKKLMAPTISYRRPIWKHVLSKQHKFWLYRRAQRFHPEDTIRFVGRVVVEGEPVRNIAFGNCLDRMLDWATDKVIQKGLAHVILGIYDRRIDREVVQVSKPVACKIMILQRRGVKISTTTEKPLNEVIDELWDRHG